MGLQEVVATATTPNELLMDSEPIRLPNPYKKQPSQRSTQLELIRIRTLPKYFPTNKIPTTFDGKPTAAIQDVYYVKVPTKTTTKAHSILSQQVIQYTKEDNLHWGDSIEVKSPNSTRIYFQNINGLRAGTIDSDKWTNTVHSLSDASVDIAGLAETNVNWCRKRIEKTMLTQLRTHYSHATITTSRNAIQFNSIKPSSNYLPGGTLLCTTNHWTGRVTENIHDPHSLGRWCGQKFRVRNDHHLYVISAYRPVRKGTSDDQTGNITVFRQQHTLLRRQGDATPNPRQRFIDDLITQINQWRENPNISVVLMLDANEVLGEEKCGITKLLKNTGLVDAFVRHHKYKCNIATNDKSRSRRIDFMFASPEILPHIKKCGYLPFYYGFDSDHRGMFLDLADSLIDGKTPLGIQITRSIGTSSHKKDILAYKHFIYTRFCDNKILEKTKELFNKASTSMQDDTAFLLELNALDSQVVQIALAAEKASCSRRPTTDWSPPLHQASLVIRYWIISIKSKRNKIKAHNQLQQIKDHMNDCTKQLIDSSDTSQLSAALRKAKKAKSMLIKQHKELRASFLQEKIKADSAYDQISIEQAAVRIANKEKHAQIFQELREIFHEGQRSGISYIIVPDKDEYGKDTDDPNKAISWKNITVPTEIEDRLINHSISHFGQGHGTSFTIPPLITELGYDGTTSSSVQLTEGSIPFDTQHLNPATIHLLKRMSNKEHLPCIDDNITFIEFWNGIKKWAEKTSTSPSLRHLGHYKVLQCSDGQEPKYSEGEVNVSYEIMQVYYLIAMAALKSGNTLTRWCQATTAMIEKKPGNPAIHKLRVIHLYEADYNMMLKILWARKLVWHSHLNNKLNDAQAGSRPGRRALDTVIQKEMKYLYSRLTRTTLASMDNDAKSCYDRIICNLAMMVSRYYGMSNRACKMQAATLQKMQFRLRTALGESKRKYQHTSESPVYGSGQGSCASPCLWLLISSLLIDCLEELGGGMTLQDINNLYIIRQWIDGYVDDTSLFTNLSTTMTEGTNTIHDVSQSLEKDMRFWADLLQASGGQLELSKCFYYILGWKFSDEGDAHPLELHEVQALTPPITIYNTTKKLFEEISQKSVDEAHRTLGAWKTMMGCEKSQIKVLQEKSDHYATIVRSSNLTRRQARVAYTSIYMPSLTYCLAAVNIDEKTLTNIQRKAVDAFLPAMGFEHSFPRDVVYGPRNFGGLNLGHLYTEQCTSKINTLILHLRANTTLGRIMRLNLDWTQLYSGRGTPILESSDKILYMADNWFLHLREFLLTIQGTLQISNSWTPKRERRGDIILMDAFEQLNLQPAQMRLINNWRLYFQVQTLSDITNAEGGMVLPCYRKRPMNANYQRSRRSKLNWPRQAEPGKQGFQHWIFCLKNCFGMQFNGKIKTKMGNWLHNPSNLNSHWNAYMSISSKNLFILVSPKIYNVYTPRYTRGTVCRYSSSPTRQRSSLPENAIPVDLHVSENGDMNVNYKNLRGLQESIIVPPKSFDEFIEQGPEWSYDLLQNWSSTDIVSIQKSIDNATARLILVSDGGLRFEQGTFGVVIGDETSILIQNQGTAHGNRELLSSFRSESYGMLSGCLTLATILKFYNMHVPPQRTLQIYSDNLGLVTRVKKHLSKPIELRDYGAADIDVELQILSEIQELIKLGFSVSIAHVHGHQDQHTPVGKLSREAQLNIAADELATDAFVSAIKPSYFRFPANITSLSIKDNFITSKQRESLHSAYLSQSLRAFMIKKFGWSDNIPSTIWWSIHGKAIKALAHNDRMRIQKFVFNRMATNKRQSKHFAHISPQCSTCAHTEENEDHMLRCLSPARERLRIEWMSRLEQFLHEPHTHYAVRVAILTGIQAWLNNLTPPPIKEVIEDASHQLIQAYDAQTEIGWQHFARGRLTLKWAHLAQHNLDVNKISDISMSAERWGRTIITINWIGVLSLWERRNTEEHGDTLESQNIITFQKLIIEAISIQATDYSISYVDRDYLFRPLADLEKYSLSNLSNWIRNARHLIITYKLSKQKHDLRKRTRYKGTINYMQENG